MSKLEIRNHITTSEVFTKFSQKISLKTDPIYSKNKNSGFDPVIMNLLTQIIEKSNSSGLFAADGLSCENVSTLLITANDGLSQHQAGETFIKVSEKDRNASMGNAGCDEPREVLISVMAKKKEPQVQNFKATKPESKPLATVSIRVRNDVDLQEAINNSGISGICLVVDQESSSTTKSATPIYVVSDQSGLSTKHRNEELKELINANATKNSAKSSESKTDSELHSQARQSGIINETDKMTHKASVDQHDDYNKTIYNVR